MEQNSFDSGEQYGLHLSYELTKIDTGLPEKLLDYWCDDVYNMAVESYQNYIIGKKDYYQLTVEEIQESYKRASTRFTEDIIDDMVDKELLNVSVDDEGEFLYSLSEEGREYAKKFRDE